MIAPVVAPTPTASSGKAEHLEISLINSDASFAKIIAPSEKKKVKACAVTRGNEGEWKRCDHNPKRHQFEHAVSPPKDINKNSHTHKTRSIPLVIT